MANASDKSPGFSRFFERAREPLRVETGMYRGDIKMKKERVKLKLTVALQCAAA